MESKPPQFLSEKMGEFCLAARAGGYLEVLVALYLPLEGRGCVETGRMLKSCGWVSVLGLSELMQGSPGGFVVCRLLKT